MNKISERLKELRLRKKLSQTHLGKEMGLSQQCISMWELKQRTPDVEEVI